MEKKYITMITFVIILMAIMGVGSTDKFQARLASLTGGDPAGWSRHSKIQTSMYKARINYKENKNLACAKNWGGVDALITIMSKNDTSAMKKNGKTVKGAERCMEEILKGPSSPRDDIPAMIKGIKSAFTNKPEPQATDETIFTKKVSPQLGGAPIIKVETGREYTIKISGRRHQFVIDPKNDKEYFTDVLADGRMPYHGNKIWIDPDPMFKQQLIDGNQPSLMAVVITGKEKLFAHNGVVTFIAKNDTWIKLTANCQQEPHFFNRSSGDWHVTVNVKT